MDSSVGAVQATGRFRYVPQPSMQTPAIGLYDSPRISNSFIPIGVSSGMGSMGFGFSPSMGAIGAPYAGDNSTYFDNMRQYQQFYNDYYIDQQGMYRNQQLQINAPMNSIQQAVRNLKDKVNQNEQGQIMQSFNSLVNVVARAYGGDPSDEDVRNQALAIYAQMNNGVTLEEDLREAGHGSFTQGLISGLTLGIYGTQSAEDNIAEITGEPVGTEQKVKKKAGGVLGGATTGGCIGGAIGGPVGAGIGAVIGGVIGLIAS